MRIACLACLLVACSSTSSGLSVRSDASPPPDLEAAEDLPPAQADAGPEVALAVDRSPDVVAVGPDTSSPVDRPPALDLPPDLLPVAVDTRALPDAGPDATARDTYSLVLPSCKYQGYVVSIAKVAQGTYCGTFPQKSPGGSPITCYTNCAIETMASGSPTPAVGAKLDSTVDGYCSANIDDRELSGDTKTRLGLCLADVATCSSVCP